jgi:hypothetical protein
MPNFGNIRRFACLTALVAVLAASAPAHALIIVGGSAQSVEHTGASFEADLTYTALSPFTAALEVTLENTSPAALGGFLTAFVLNNPVGISLVSLASPIPTNWMLLGLDNDAVNGAPFGRFDFGATTAPNGNSNSGFEGGGDPDRGFAPGTSETFMFDLIGIGLDTLTAESFLSAFSVPPGAGEGTQFFAARFRGLSGTPDSDKVAAVPEISSYAALAVGIVLLLFRVRRRLD